MGVHTYTVDTFNANDLTALAAVPQSTERSTLRHRAYTVLLPALDRESGRSGPSQGQKQRNRGFSSMDTHLKRDPNTLEQTTRRAPTHHHNETAIQCCGYQELLTGTLDAETNRDSSTKVFRPVTRVSVTV
jgi:hypothetical protein